MPVRSDIVPSRDSLAALVLGREAAWRECAVWPPDVLVRQAEHHGVLPLLADAATSAGAACPTGLGTLLHQEATRHLAGDLVRERELRRVLEALDAARIPVLVMKGADLAYGHYRRPDLRTRTDSDLLVDDHSRSEASATLRALGYVSVPQTGGDLLMYQEPFRLVRGAAVVHVVDLHWRVFNPQRYGTSLSFADLSSRARQRPTLSPVARGLDPMHALILASVHRVAHHFGHDRLIWLYDVKVLADALQPAEWNELLTLAHEGWMRDACHRTLAEGRHIWRAAVPDAVLETLAGPEGRSRDDDPYFDPRAPHVRRILSDFRHLNGWRARLALARQHLFPPVGYMRTIYAPSSAAPLWVLYLRRILRGSRRWLARS